MTGVKLIKKLCGLAVKITHSIKGKLLLCFSLIITVLVFTSIFTFHTGNQLNLIYDGILERHVLLNNLFLNLSITNGLLEKYQLSASPEDLERFEESYPLLFQHSEDFENLMSNMESRRVATDLKYMIQSYAEEASSSAMYLKEGKRKESYSHYYDARRIYHLINDAFKDISSALEKDSLESRRKIENNNNYLVNGILIILMTIFCVVFVNLFSSSITKPLKKLTDAARKVSDGEMDIGEVIYKSSDETGILAEAFNTMVKRIHSQIAEIRDKNDIEQKLKDEEVENLKMKSLFKEMEFKSLQARINPHFLFNTLNMVSQMAFIEEAPQTLTLLEAMNELLRYNLDKFDKIVTMKEDFQNLKDYVFIQQQRFGDRIRFETAEDEKAAEGLIPCLILQPLVENAIIHGLGKYTKGALVIVNLIRNVDRVQISIRDNGVGMDRDKLEAIRDMICNGLKSDDSSNIGLRNVISRLKLFYNNDLEFDITSEIGRGTEIVINLPYIIEGDRNVCTAS